MRIFKKKKKRSTLDLDEIFLDSKNLENFDRQQFEGRIEKPIARKTVKFVGAFFVLMIIVFGSRLVYLQIQNGEDHRKRSDNNILEKINIFTERGIIYDRNKKELAWNRNDGKVLDLYTRAYLSPGFSHVLGYVSYPAKDETGNYWQNEFIGKDGLEKEYNDKLMGENGSKIIETDALGKVHSENIINAPKKGDDLLTTLDSRIQMELFTLLRNSAENYSFSGGAGIMMNVRNGEILASTSFPEYNSEILSLGNDLGEINKYINDPRKFFLDRTISGLYTPGSIVKPFLALGALMEGIIDPAKKILSTGSISIPNPYFPDQKSIFKDWKAHGWTNMIEALAVSSDVYFYTIGGGFEDQRGMGIANIEKYTKLFGIGEATGVDLPDEKNGIIPNPEWKLKNFRGDPWRLGDTYHTAIGQYGFQVTPIEMVRAITAIANSGIILTPHFILEENSSSELLRSKASQLEIKEEYFNTVRNGMRQAVTYGTAVALNVPFVEVAAKTGTAQLGVAKNKINSWVIGFFPYENPQYAFTIMMEAGPATNSVNASSVMRQLLDWMSQNTPEYFEVLQN